MRDSGRGRRPVTGNQAQTYLANFRQADEPAVEWHSVAWKSLRDAQCYAEPGGDRSPKAGEALAGEDEPPGDAGGVERSKALPTEQAELVEHHQRQRLLTASHEVARPDPGHRQPREMLGARGVFPPLLPRERQIEITMVNRLDQHHAAVDAHLHLDAWMRAPEMAEHLREPGLGKIPQHPKPHLAGERRLLERRHRFVVELKQAARIAEHDLAFGREREAAPLLPQERLAGRLL